MIQISVFEFESDIDKYLSLAQTEDVLIAKNGKVAARLTKVETDKTDAAKSCFGMLPDCTDLDQLREERLQ